MVSISCRTCSQSFETDRTAQRYCSIACALWGRVVKQPSGCWEWTGSRAKGRYGGLTFRGARYDTHRVAFEITHGSANGLFVCHSCDNPICCNPEHLFAGTPLDNTRDMDMKGRRKSRSNPRKGMAHPCAKLTDEAVIEIRAAYRPGWRVGEMERKFGVTRHVLYGIARGERWKHIT